MTCTMDEIVAAAKNRGYRTKYKIDSKNNSQYGIITKDGNSSSFVTLNRTEQAE